MRSIGYILLIGIVSCNSRESNPRKLIEYNLSSKHEVPSDSTKQLEISNEPEIFYNEFEITPQDSLFLKLDLDWKEITEGEFYKYERNYKPNCQIDSNGFISGKGLTVKTECHEICVTSLFEIESGDLMILPCTFDQGILGLVFSNSCDQFVTYSSYDAPDFNNYYEHRAELTGFNITRGKGLDCIKPFFKYYNKEWSIDKLIWITDKKIAIRVYTQGMPSNGNDFQFQYYTTEI